MKMQASPMRSFATRRTEAVLTERLQAVGVAPSISALQNLHTK